MDFSHFAPKTKFHSRAYIKHDKSYDQLNKSILDAITINGGIYGIPVGYAPRSVIFNQGLATELGLTIDTENMTWSEVLRLAKELESQDGLYLFKQMNGLEGLLISMLIPNMPDLIDLQNKTCDLRQDWFMNLLQQLKEVSSLGCLNDDYGVQGDKNYLFLEKINRSFLGAVNDYNYLQPGITYLPPFSGEINRNRVAYTTVMYSISNNSQNKDAAWEFLSYLIAEDTGTLDSLTKDEVPLNNASVDKLISQSNSKPSQEYLDRFCAFLDVDYLYDMSYYKKDLADPIMEYLLGTTTLARAITKAEYNIMLRMHE